MVICLCSYRIIGNLIMSEIQMTKVHMKVVQIYSSQENANNTEKSLYSLWGVFFLNDTIAIASGYKG